MSYMLGTVSLSMYSAGARVQIQDSPITPDYGKLRNHLELSFTFENNMTNQNVVVSVMLLASTTSLPANAPYVMLNSAVSSYPGLYALYSLVKNLQGVAGTLYGVSALGLFNQLDLSLFYTIQDNNNGCTTNYLLNKFFYQLPPTADPSFTGSPYLNPTRSMQLTTGNLLCWGSNTNLGTVRLNLIQFQTHLRDNFGLWVGWWSALILWVSMLYGESVSQSVFDPYYADNKWTCWSMYSLFHLAHEDFFSRMLRNIPMFIIFWWQACVNAVLYSQLAQMMPMPTNIPM